jgi:hypothetical protein
MESVSYEAIEPLRYLVNGGDQIGLGSVVERTRQVLERARGADD